jgi:hypothetical protein
LVRRESVKALSFAVDLLHVHPQGLGETFDHPIAQPAGTPALDITDGLAIAAQTAGEARLRHPPPFALFRD